MHRLINANITNNFRNKPLKPIQMVDLVSQYTAIKQEIDQEIQNVINSSIYINGPKVGEFACNLAGYVESKYALGCGNGTDAIQIALMALDLQPGDEVITTPFTFVATVEVISLLGLVPKFVDIDPQTFNLDVSQLEDVITDRTRVILPVHLFGQATEMSRLMTIANKHNLSVIEDNAQSIGCDVKVGEKWQKTATVGDFGTFSFFPSKNLGCYGDGGAIVANKEEHYTRAKMIAKHGSKLKYHYDVIGINSRLDAMQAAILDVKLQYLDDYIQRRQHAAEIYDTSLAEIEGVTIPHRADYSTHVFHQYTLRVNANRDKLKEDLAAQGIPSMIYYPKALHLQPAYQYLGYKEGDFPHAELACKEVLSLPMHTELSIDQQNFIIDNLINNLA